MRLKVIKAEDSKEFLKEFNKNVVTQEFLESCAKAGRLFKGVKMGRLTRLCRNTEGGKYGKYVTDNYVGIYSDIELSKAIDKLGYYEDLEEEGRLVILSVDDIHPCKNCDTGWGSVSSDGVCECCYDNCDRLKKYNEKYNEKYM